MGLTTRNADRIVCPFDHTSAEYAEKHQEILAEIQEAAPLAWSDAHGGFWVATSFDVVRKLAADGDSLHIGDFGVVFPGNPNKDRMRFVPGEANGEPHDKYRLALNPRFTREWVDTLEPVIDRYIARALDRFVEDGEIDIINDYLQPAIKGVACDYLGVEVENPVQFMKDISEGFAYGGGTEAFAGPEDSKERFDRAWGHLARIVDARRAHPTGDVVSHLVQWTDPVFADDEIYRMVVNIILGAGDTTSSLLSEAIVWLEEHPDVRAHLAANPASIGDETVDEFLRLISPVHTVGRTAVKDIDVGEFTIKTGDTLVLSFYGANHDPRKYPDPYTFDPTRSGVRQHVAMSVGAHFCLGRWLAKRISSIAIRELLLRAPNYHVVAERAQTRPIHVGLGRWLTMPVRVR